MKKHRVFFRCLASCCRLDKGTPLSASWLRREPLLKRVAFCVHIVSKCLVFSLSSSGKRCAFRGAMDVRVKPEHDKKKNKPEHDKL